MRILLMVALAVSCSSRDGTSTTPPPSLATAPTEPAASLATAETPAGIDGMRFILTDAPKPIPKGVAPNVFDGVRLSSVRILASDAELAERVSVDELKRFVTTANYISMLAVGLNNMPVDLKVRFDLGGSLRETRIEVVKGVLEPKMKENVRRGLDGIPPLDVKGELAIVMTFTLETSRELDLVMKADPRGKVISSVKTLTSYDDLALRTDARSMSDFHLAIKAHAERTLGASSKRIEVKLRMRCTPAGHTFEIATRGEPDPTLVQALRDAITAMPKLATTGDAEFELHFVVAP